MLSAKVVVGSLDYLLEAIPSKGIGRLRYCARKVVCVLSCVQLCHKRVHVSVAHHCSDCYSVAP